MLEIQISFILCCSINLKIDFRNRLCPYLLTLTVRNQVHGNEITSPCSQSWFISHHPGLLIFESVFFPAYFSPTT